MIGLREEPRKCGNDWTWGIFAGGRNGRRVKRETRPREHEGFSQIIASLSIVFCSTGTILRRKGNGEQKYGKGKVKTRTLETHEDAAPKTILPLQWCAARL